jgi:uncharacterized membrane protein YfhO
MAFVEADDPTKLAGYLDGSPVDPAESVSITSHEPQQVELTAVLKNPGLVILADLNYPGWRLEIDGNPAPILRVNRMMRGAAVQKGTHRLVYTYVPRSFRIGMGVSIAGLVSLSILIAWAVRGSRRARQS